MLKNKIKRENNIYDVSCFELFKDLQNINNLKICLINS